MAANQPQILKISEELRTESWMRQPHVISYCCFKCSCDHSAHICIHTHVVIYIHVTDGNQSSTAIMSTE